MIAAGRTHIGKVRRRNEDSYYVGAHLAAAADGMGGHVAGDVASETVIEALKAFDRAVPDRVAAVTLAHAVAAASQAMRQRITADPALAGMGTTLVAVLVAGPVAAVASIGDSRIYRLRSGILTALTEDHVYANLVSNAAAAPGYGERISRFLDGRSDGRSPDISTIAIEPGDRILLCSDGLSSFVPAHVIRDTMGNGEPATATDELIRLALEAGGLDNITAVVLDA